MLIPSILLVYYILHVSYKIDYDFELNISITKL